MVHRVISTTHEVIERILPETAVYSLRIGTKYLEKVLEKAIQKANEGLPVIGHHFAFQREYLSCFELYKPAR